MRHSPRPAPAPVAIFRPDAQGALVHVETVQPTKKNRLNLRTVVPHINSLRSNTMTKQEFVAMVVANHKTGKWLSCIVEVEGVQVGIKAFGKWVQRMEGNYKPYWSSDQCKTVSSFKSAVETGINYILQGA